MQVCPYCGQEALSAVRKAMLGPAQYTLCRSCRKRISVGWRSIWAVVPLLAGLTAARHLAWPFGIAAMIAGLVAMIVIHVYLVPLVGRDD